MQTIVIGHKNPDMESICVLGLQGAVPVEGGIPLLIDGETVGAIGVSGATSQQDGQMRQVGRGSFQIVPCLDLEW